MTVIACSAHERVMIADTLISADEGRYLNGNAAKIFRCSDGSIVGAAGDNEKCWTFLDWAINGRKGKLSADLWAKDSQLEGLILTPRAEILWFTGASPDHPIQDPFAIGYGGQACRAALLAGAPLQRAVEIACELCSNCGGPLTVMRLDGPAKKARRVAVASE